MEKKLSRRTVVSTGLATLVSGSVSGPALAKIDWDGYPRVLHGPMIGATTTHSIKIWVRLSGDYESLIEYSDRADFSSLKRTVPQKASAETEYILEFTLSDLPADTIIYYRVVVDGVVPRDHQPLLPFVTKTAPAGPAAFSVAFGSCARHAHHPIQPVWDAVQAQESDLFFWLGDNIYGDSLNPAILAEEYRRQRGVANFLPLMRSTPQLAIWDDHDYGLNDHDKRHPGKKQSLEVFKRYWANPAYGLPAADGVFFRYSYGGVDFFFLDNRYHKDPADAPDVEGKSLLGEVQLAWLKEALLQSTAPFKVLVSGMGWTEAKGPTQEAWSSYLSERNTLFDYIAQNNISGVVLLSGDTHIAELNAIPWSDRGGYDLFELVSSPLAQECSTSWLNYRPIPRIRQVYAGGPNFGHITFDCTVTDPVLTLTARNIYGQSIWPEVRLTASELVNGQRTHLDKMDARSKTRWKRHLSGEPYYG